METNSSASNKKMPGEMLAVVLTWAAWCFIALTILIILIASFVDDYSYPKGISRSLILLTHLRSTIHTIYYALVLFGISAVIKAVNAKTVKTNQPASEQKQ